MADSTDISDSDSELFRRSIGTVDKIEHDQIALKSPKPAPIPRQKQTDEKHIIEQMGSAPFAVADVETGDELLFIRPGIQHQIIRKLRRGKFAIEQELDLHGMTVNTARTTLTRFLADCRTTNRRCIRIIHGKGLGSKNKQPILKNKLNQWLQKQNEVIAFCSARPADGGTGAVYVLLKKF